MTTSGQACVIRRLKKQIDTRINHSDFPEKIGKRREEKKVAGTKEMVTGTGAPKFCTSVTISNIITSGSNTEVGKSPRSLSLKSSLSSLLPRSSSSGPADYRFDISDFDRRTPTSQTSKRPSQDSLRSWSVLSRASKPSKVASNDPYAGTYLDFVTSQKMKAPSFCESLDFQAEESERTRRLPTHGDSASIRMVSGRSRSVADRARAPSRSPSGVSDSEASMNRAQQIPPFSSFEPPLTLNSSMACRGWQNGRPFDTTEPLPRDGYNHVQVSTTGKPSGSGGVLLTGRVATKATMIGKRPTKQESPAKPPTEKLDTHLFFSDAQNYREPIPSTLSHRQNCTSSTLPLDLTLDHHNAFTSEHTQTGSSIGLSNLKSVHPNLDTRVASVVPKESSYKSQIPHQSSFKPPSRSASDIKSFERRDKVILGSHFNPNERTSPLAPEPIPHDAVEPHEAVPRVPVIPPWAHQVGPTIKLPILATKMRAGAGECSPTVSPLSPHAPAHFGRARISLGAYSDVSPLDQEEEAMESMKREADGSRVLPDYASRQIELHERQKLKLGEVRKSWKGRRKPLQLDQ